MDFLRRLLPYTTAAVVIAAIYAGVTLYSRYRDQVEEQKKIEDRKAALDRKVVAAYGGEQLTILTFAAEPPVVAPGGRVLLCYGVNNAITVKIEPDVPPIKPAVTHCLEVHPKRTTRYTLTAEDAKGNRKEQGLTIQVRPVTPASDAPAP